MAVNAILVNGVNVDLGTIAADVTIRIGRQDIYTTWATSTARVVFYDVVTDTTEAYVGRSLDIKRTASVYNFRGVISDATLTVATATSGATLTVTAIGVSSKAAFRPVGAGGYASQTSWARVQAIMAEAGLGIVPQSTTDVQNRMLAAYTSGQASAQSLVEQVNTATRSFIYDAPDGNINWQSIEKRNDYATLTVDPTKTIFSPVWQQSTQVINDVQVDYAGGSVYTTDARSIAIYGTRAISITTTLTSITDASTLARLILARSKRPRWQLDSVGILQTSTEVAYNVGQPVKLTTLPTGSPASTAYGIIEGWEHRYVGDRHTTTYFISDPVQSGIALAWEDIPAGTAYQWQDVLPIVWDDAITLADAFA